MPSVGELGIELSDEDSDLMNNSYNLDRYGYARRTINSPRVNGHRESPVIMHMHREVLARIVGRELTRDDTCDHANRNKLDNRRENLRLVSWMENSQNRDSRAGSTSRYRGVTWHKTHRKWQAQVGHNGRYYYCGSFESEEEAAEASRAKRQELGFLGDRP